MAHAVALLLAAAIFTSIERRWPAIPGRSAWRRPGRFTDIAYWLFVPFLNRAAIAAATVIAVLPIALALGAPLGPRFDAWVAARRTGVSLQPAWAQAIEILILADLIGYWTHRLFHRRPLWRFHAVHHATRDLDWLSAARVHPVNEALSRAASVVPLFALGFRGEVLAGVTPLLAFYAVAVHANLRWTYGPLRYILASPAFHRWHHAADIEARDKNFAGLFPVWDLLFGTFYMPVGVSPRGFGVEEEVPDGLIAQLAWPFRRARPLR